MNLSVVMPSYKNPKYLDLSLQSAIKTQTKRNEIIVVLDGFADLSRDVVEKYKDYISVLEFDENKGMPSAINYGFYNATNQYVLVAAEDNIFPQGWDKILSEHAQEMTLISCNQIEPKGPSMYDYKFHNFGLSIEEFNLDNFLQEELKFREDKISTDGCTFPFFMSKKLFMMVGGFDTSYTSPFVVDWDFFLKIEMIPTVFIEKLHHLNFYHFVSKSTKNRNGYIENIDERNNFFAGEQQAGQYFEYKWGFRPQRDKNNRCKPFMPF